MYNYAKEQYAAIGVDTENALKTLDTIPVSMHCWQGDDVRGFEQRDGGLTGGMFNFTKRLTLMEEGKTLPWTAVWDEYCSRKNVPSRLD